MTTLSLQDNMPSGVYALYQAVLNRPIRQIAGFKLKAADDQSLADLLIRVYLHPSEYPGIDLNDFDKECAAAAELIRASGGVQDEEREAT